MNEREKLLTIYKLMICTDVVLQFQHVFPSHLDLIHIFFVGFFNSISWLLFAICVCVCLCMCSSYFQLSSLSPLFAFSFGIIYIAFAVYIHTYIHTLYYSLHIPHSFLLSAISYFCGKSTIICAMNSVCYSVHLNVAACFTTICFMHFQMKAYPHEH